MNDSEKIKTEIRKFILKTSYVSEEMLDNDTLIFAQGIMDSMGFMSLVSFLDENFRIKVNDTELIESNFESVDAIGNYLVNKINSN
jgi:acyl carrier protein